jgi:membrane protease YdiL (CAAX protease family)
LFNVPGITRYELDKLQNSSVPEPTLSEPTLPEPLPAGAALLQKPAHGRLVAIAEILLCCGVPTQTLIGLVLQLAGWTVEQPAGRMSLAFILTLSLADTVVLVALMVALTRAHGDSATELWLGRRSVRTEVLLGILLIPLVFVGVVILLNVLRLIAPGLHNVPQNPLEQLAGTATEAAMFAMVAIVAGGIREELQRAFLLRRFEQHLGGPVVGVVALSIAFGFAHQLQGWDVGITTGALGAFWAIVYLRRRSSVAPIVSHAGFNTLEILRVSLTN